MRLIKTLAAGALSSLSLACAAGTTLDFEGVPDLDPIGSFYSGFTFSNNAFGLVAVGPGGSGGSGRFIAANMPSPSTALGFSQADTDLFDIRFIINVTGGFTDSLNFFYSNIRGTTGFVELFSGLNGEGTQVGASLTLGSVDQRDCPPLPNQEAGICRWNSDGIDFTGTAYSVRISALGGSDLFLDNMRFGSDEPGNNVPEPASLALALAAAGAAALTRRRKLAARAA